MAAPRRSAARSLAGFALILGGWFAYEKWSSDLARAREDGANDALTRASPVWPEPSTVTVPSHAPGQTTWPIFTPPELAPESIVVVTTAPTGVPAAVHTSAETAWQAFVRLLYTRMTLIVGTLERFSDGLMHSRQLQLTIAMFALLFTLLVLVLGSHLYTAFMFLYYIIALPIRLAFTPFAWLYNNLRRARELGELQERVRRQFTQIVNLRAQNTDLTNRLDAMTRRAEAAEANARQRRTDYDRALNAQTELIESNRVDNDTLNQTRQELFASREQTRVANEARSRRPSLAASPIITVSSAPVPGPLPLSPMFAVDTAPAAPHFGFSMTTSVATRPIPTSVRTTTGQNQFPVTENQYLAAQVQRLKELRKTDAAELAKLRSQAQKDESLAESVSSANRSSSKGMKELLTIIEQRDSLIRDLRRSRHVQRVIADKELDETKRKLATRSTEHKATGERETQLAKKYKTALGDVAEREMRIADLTSKLQAAEDENKSNKEALGSKAAQSKLDDCENRVSKLTTDIEASQDALAQANQAVTAKTNEKKALEARISQVTLELEQANSLRDFRDNKIRKSKRRIHELEQELEAAQSRIADLASELQIAQDVQTATREDLEGKTAELHAAEVFIDKLTADTEAAARKKEDACKEALAAEREEHKKTRNALAAANKADGTCKEDLAVGKANHKKTQDALSAAEAAQKATGEALEVVTAEYKSAETRVDKLIADLEAAKEEDGTCKKALATEKEVHKKTQDALVTARNQNKACQEALTGEKAGHNRTRDALVAEEYEHMRTKDALAAAQNHDKACKEALAAEQSKHKDTKNSLKDSQVVYNQHEETEFKLDADLKSCKEELEATRVKLRTAQQDLGSCKENHKVITSELEAAQLKISELEAAAEQAPGRSQEDFDTLSADLESCKKELETAKAKLTDCKEQVSKLKERVPEVEVEGTRAVSITDENDNTLVERSDPLETDQDTLTTTQNALTTTQNALTTTQNALTTTQNTLASVESDRAQARERLTAVESDLAQARESRAAEAERHAETTEWLAHVNANHSQTLKQLADSKAVVQEQQTRITDLEERLRNGERNPSVGHGRIPSTSSSNRTQYTWPTNSPTSIHSFPIMRPVRRYPEERRFSLRPDNRIVLRPGEEDPNGDTATHNSSSEAEEPQQPADGPPRGPQPQPEHARTPPPGKWPPATASFRRPQALPLHPMHPMHPDNVRLREQQSEGGMQTAPLPTNFGQRPGTAPPAIPRQQGQTIYPATAPAMPPYNPRTLQGTVRDGFMWNGLGWQPLHPVPLNPNVLNFNPINPNAFSFPRQNLSPGTPEDNSR